MIKQILGLELLKCNFKSILIFEICYKFIAALLFAPLVLVIVNFSLKLAGIKYLSNENISYFFTNPSTIIIICLFILCLILYSLFEVMALIGCFQASYYDKKISSLAIFRLGSFSAKKLFKGKNFLLIVISLLIYPIVNFIQLYGCFSNLKLLGIISNFISTNRPELLTCFLIIMVVSLFAMKLIYSLCYFCTENYNLKKSVKKGLRLISENYIKTVFGLLLWNITIALAAGIILIIGVFLVFVTLKILGISETANIIALQAYRWIFISLVGLYMLFSTPISFAYICSFYYKERCKDGEIMDFYKEPEAAFKNPNIVKNVLLIMTVILIISNISIFIFEPNVFKPNIQFFHNTNVTAHRGDSINAPENTIAAFESAITHYADWIELDLKQTKDGVIVVMHDSNLKRTAGINKNIWEVTYDEIKNLDVGAWFSEEFVGEKIPTLDEVIKHVNGRAKLNIELKPTGYEKDFEKEVIRIIKENNIEEQCVITSLKYNTLKRVKEIAPEIKTIFVSGVAYGNLADLKYADGFSIEQNFITKKLVNSIKNKEKDLYVWTVNNMKMIEKMIELGVDNIITDNPLKAKETIYKKYAPDTFVKLFTQTINKK